VTVPLKNQFGCQRGDTIFGAGAVFYVTPYAEEGRSYACARKVSALCPNKVWQSVARHGDGSGVLVDGTLFAAAIARTMVDGARLGHRRGPIATQELTTGAAIYADGGSTAWTRQDGRAD